MAASTPKSSSSLTDLPPELWAHIVRYLPTASAVASLSATSKSLHNFAKKDGWKIFSRTRFPSLGPEVTASYYETARSLTTVSKAWDRRALVARYIEPRGNIVTFPGGHRIARWRPPRGQTIGFTPQLDVFEQIGSTWRDRQEVLAFSAGAEVCIRQTRRYDGGEGIKWTTYRPRSAQEGRDDVTTLHMLRLVASGPQDRHGIITGTANGDLQLRWLPGNDIDPPADVATTYFTTQGMPVRSTTLLQELGTEILLAAGLGDSTLALYHVDEAMSKICPASKIVVQPSLRADGNLQSPNRIWSTKFLSPSTLAVGVGPSETPLHIYRISESGMSQAPFRTFPIRDDGGTKRMSSLYATAPLPTGLASSGNGDVFLSGAFDGIVRLHDLRSPHDSEHSYGDSDDSAVYTILPRGQERLVVGTSRHNLLKVFDLRLGARRYSYLQAQSPAPEISPSIQSDTDYNIFLRPNNSCFASRGNNWPRNRHSSAQSSVYSLASSSPHSPYIYAGVENAICSLAFSEILDLHPDPAYFDPWSAQSESKAERSSRNFYSTGVFDLAMYNQGPNMQLYQQQNLWETLKFGVLHKKDRREHLDERWKSANQRHLSESGRSNT